MLHTQWHIGWWDQSQPTKGRFGPAIGNCRDTIGAASTVLHGWRNELHGTETLVKGTTCFLLQDGLEETKWGKVRQCHCCSEIKKVPVCLDNIFESSNYRILHHDIFHLHKHLPFRNPLVSAAINLHMASL